MEEILDILKAQVATINDEGDLIRINDQVELAVDELKTKIENTKLRLEGLQKLGHILRDRIDEL